MQDFVGAKLVLTHAGRLAALLRDDFAHIPWPGHWDLPGGGAEPGETPAGCALRELVEELGLRLPRTRLDAGMSFPAGQYPERRSWLFHARLTEGEIRSMRLGDEGQDWRMMPIAEFLDHPKVVPYFPDRVRRVLDVAAVVE